MVRVHNGIGQSINHFDLPLHIRNANPPVRCHPMIIENGSESPATNACKGQLLAGIIFHERDTFCACCRVCLSYSDKKR